jgi:hypothetical protein
VAETVAKLIEQGEFELKPGIIADEKVRAIEKVCERLGDVRFRPIKDALPDDITFHEIRIVVAELKRRATNANAEQADILTSTSPT